MGMILARWTCENTRYSNETKGLVDQSNTNTSNPSRNMTNETIGHSFRKEAQKEKEAHP
jgi:hypothetical protein